MNAETPRPSPPPPQPPKPAGPGRMIRRLAAVVLLVAALLSTASCEQYETCREAIKSGAAPLHRGDPGWNGELDRDGDGVACENGRTTP